MRPQGRHPVLSDDHQWLLDTIFSSYYGLCIVWRTFIIIYVDVRLLHVD